MTAVRKHDYSDRKVWLKYDFYKDLLKKIDKLEDLQSIQRKINVLTRIIPQIGTTLGYLEALSDRKEQEEEAVA